MSIKINKIALSSYNFKCELEHDHDAAPQTIDRFIEIDGMPGAYDYGADMSVRNFRLPLAVIKPGSNMWISDAMRSFRKAILDDYGNPKEFDLSFDYDSSKFYKARYRGSMPLERLIHKGRFILPLTAFDPFAHSVVQNNEITWGSTELTFNSEYLFGSTNSQTYVINEDLDKTITENVNGDAVRPVINISGSATTLTVSCNGKSFTLSSFSSADFIIDSQNYTVIKDSLNGLSSFTGDFIELLPGDNDITITGTGMDFTFEVVFRDKYMM